MRGCKKRGWVLFEVMIVVACFALVFAIYQRQQSRANQALYEALEQHRISQQLQMQQQIGRLFEVSISLESDYQLAAPNCQNCRSAALQQLLRYELNQW